MEKSIFIHILIENLIKWNDSLTADLDLWTSLDDKLS